MISPLPVISEKLLILTAFVKVVVFAVPIESPASGLPAVPTVPIMTMTGPATGTTAGIQAMTTIMTSVTGIPAIPTGIPTGKRIDRI